jgi:hypothetical protein
MRRIGRLRGGRIGRRAGESGGRLRGALPGGCGPIPLSFGLMGIANAQNMVRTVPVLPQPYGIRVRLKPGDPFAKLLGTDWQRTHWFFTAAERDRVMEDMARKHEYSRIGDQPALVFEKVEKLAESRGF